MAERRGRACASSASASGPRRPAPRRAVSERRSTSTSRSARQVEADQPAVGAAQRLDPADDAGAAAEGDDGDALGRRRRSSTRLHRVGVGGQHDGVGRRLELAGAQPGEVDVAAAGRVAEPVLGAGEDVLLADRLDQRLRQRLGAAAARSRPARRRAAPAAARRSARAASPAPARRARARSRGRPTPTTSSRGAARSRQRPLDPVERLVEQRALAAPHHRRAEPREAAQGLRGARRHLGARRPRRASAISTA